MALQFNHGSAFIATEMSDDETTAIIEGRFAQNDYYVVAQYEDTGYSAIATVHLSEKALDLLKKFDIADHLKKMLRASRLLSSNLGLVVLPTGKEKILVFLPGGTEAEVLAKILDQIIEAEHSPS